jgi:chromate transporter
MATCALVLIFFHAPWLQPVMIAAGALTGLACLRAGATTRKHEELFAQEKFLPPRLAAGCLALFALVLGLALFWQDGNELADLFARFYRTGAMVFGGGHVVLPLLQAETVKTGLVSHDVFLAGYGAAQALPGPLFAFAAFLGACMKSVYPPWLLGLWCLFAILVPSLLLIVGALPFWARLTNNASAQAAMKGANAAVVGLLVAAFYDPVWTSGVTSWRAFVLALIAFALLQFGKVPNWAIVIGCAVLGEALL